MRKLQFIGIILASLLMLGSCGIGKSNFNKQKYTHLKSKKVEYSEEEIVQTGTDIIESPDLNRVNDELSDFVFSDQPVSGDKRFEADNELADENDKESARNLNFDFIERLPFSKTKAFNSSEKGSGGYDDFNLFFKIGLMIFLLSVLLIAMAIFANSWVLFLFCVVTGPALLVATWIMSFIVIRKGKFVSEEDKTGNYQLQIFLAYLVAVIGIGVAAFLTGGMLFLLLFW